MTTTNGTSFDPRALSMVQNAFTFRSDLMRRLALDPRRDIDDECGFTKAPTIEHFQDFYDREPIAARVVEVWPKESWQSYPEVYEDEDPDVLTPFEEDWRALPSQLRGEVSYYEGEEGSPIYEALRDVDIKSGIGTFGILLLGFDDGRPLSEPLKGFTERNSTPSVARTPSTNQGAYSLTVNAEPGRKLLYLRTFSESEVTISQWETNLTSPRYGQPVEYGINLSGNETDHTHAVTSTLVHWSRIIHVTDGGLFHAPRMETVFNNLYSLKKVYSADAEAFWKNCLIKLILETNPQLAGSVTYDREATKDAVEQFTTGLQPYLGLTDISAKTIAPQVVDPTAHIDTQIEAICIRLGIPKRIFMGSERGELASTQDDDAWNGRVRGNQCSHCTPHILIPFIDRLIGAGVLRAPASYTVYWPDRKAQTEAEKADIAVKRTQALAQYVQSGAEALMPPIEFLTYFLGFTDDEAKSILDSAVERMEEEESLTLPEEPEVPPEGQPVDEYGQPVEVGG